MAQDFGDDAGDILLRWLKRMAMAGGRHLLHTLVDQSRQERQDYYEKQGISQGMSPEEAARYASELGNREHDVIPFGEANEAAAVAATAKENGLYAQALTDQEGHGFLLFAHDDLNQMQALQPKFAEVLTQLQIQRIKESWQTPPLEADQIEKLTPVKDSYKLYANEKNPSLSQQLTRHNRTQNIADVVKEAKATTTSFDQFKEKLAQQGIGTTTAKDGELMYYEARSDSLGRMLPYERSDWSVSAATLKNKYGVDATHDAFLRSTDGGMDTRGETQELDQGIKSHDSVDTDTHTTQIEREGSGTIIPPSKTREKTIKDDYDLNSQARDMKASSRQYNKEYKEPGKDHDISDKFNQERGR